MSIFKCKCGEFKLPWGKCKNPNCTVDCDNPIPKAIKRKKVRQDGLDALKYGIVSHVPTKPISKAMLKHGILTDKQPWNIKNKDIVNEPYIPIAVAKPEDFRDDGSGFIQSDSYCNAMAKFVNAMNKSGVTVQQANDKLKTLGEKLSTIPAYGSEPQVDEYIDREGIKHAMRNSYRDFLLYGKKVEVVNRLERDEIWIRIDKSTIPFPAVWREDYTKDGLKAVLGGRKGLDNTDKLIIERLIDYDFDLREMASDLLVDGTLRKSK